LEIEAGEIPAITEISINFPDNPHFASSRPVPVKPRDSEKCGIFVVAENRLLRDLLCELVAARPAFSMLGIEAAVDDSLLARIAEAGDSVGLVFLSNLSTPERFVDQIEPLRNACPRLRLVLVGMPPDPRLFLAAVASGVAGYVLDDAPTDEVLAALEAVARGDVACPNQFLAVLFRSIAGRNESDWRPGASNPFGLSRREGELLPLVARGWTNKQIALELHLSEQTVKNHLRRMLRKAGATNRVAMVERCRHAATQAAAVAL